LPVVDNRQRPDQQASLDEFPAPTVVFSEDAPKLSHDKMNDRGFHG